MSTSFQLMSNEDSPLRRALDKELGITDISYALPAKNFGSMAKGHVSTNPSVAISGAPASQRATFPVARYAFPHIVFAETSLTTASNLEANTTNLGERIYNKIALRSGSKTIQEYDQHALHAFIRDCEPGKNALFSYMTQCFDSNYTISYSFSSNTVTTFTPLFFVWDDSIESKVGMDLRSLEPLEIELTFATQAQARLAGALTAATPKLHMFYFDVAPRTYAAIRAKQLKPSVPMNIFTWSTYTDYKAITNGDTSTVVDINVNYLVSKSYVMIVDEVSAAANANSKPKGVYKLSLSVSGATLYENLPGPLCLADAANADRGLFSCSGAGAITSDAASPTIMLDWGLVGKSRAFPDGGLSFNGLISPQLTVYHADPGTTTAKVFVVHVYNTLLNVNPGDGTITKHFSY